MRAVIVVSFAGVVGALAAQAVPAPQPATPAGQVSQLPGVPTRQVPSPPVPTVPVAQPVPPAAPVPQQAVPMGQLPQSAVQADQVFEGTWSASGQRQILPTEVGAPAVTVQLSGAITIMTGAGLGRGFRGEVIGFDDGAGLIAGRAVWTDQRGDRIFSVLRGDALAAAGRQIRGSIMGGTGRYAGLTGEYELQWQYVIATEASQVSGRAVKLRGRVRPGSGGR